MSELSWIIGHPADVKELLVGVRGNPYVGIEYGIIIYTHTVLGMRHETCV